MCRRSTTLLVLLLTTTAACGSTTDTVDSVENSPTTSSEGSDDAGATEAADAATVPESPPATDGADDQDVPESTTTTVGTPTDTAAPVEATVVEGTAVTQISPQAVPSLSTVPESPRETMPGAFPLDPDSARVQATVVDLADRLGLPVSDISVVEASAVMWGDSSLGCPQPGMQYLQRVTDGSLVVLSAGGVDYRYTGGDPLKLCGEVAGA